MVVCAVLVSPPEPFVVEVELVLDETEEFVKVLAMLAVEELAPAGPVGVRMETDEALVVVAFGSMA